MRRRLGLAPLVPTRNWLYKNFGLGCVHVTILIYYNFLKPNPIFARWTWLLWWRHVPYSGTINRLILYLKTLEKNNIIMTFLITSFTVTGGYNSFIWISVCHHYGNDNLFKVSKLTVGYICLLTLKWRETLKSCHGCEIDPNINGFLSSLKCSLISISVHFGLSRC